MNIAFSALVFQLAGIMYPLAGLPDLVRDVVVYVVPFTAAVETFRGAIDGRPIADYARELLIAFGWHMLAFALASRAYRFTDERGSGARSRFLVPLGARPTR